VGDGGDGQNWKRGTRVTSVEGDDGPGNRDWKRGTRVTAVGGDGESIDNIMGN
jgi:hypothetical protein